MHQWLFGWNFLEASSCVKKLQNQHTNYFKRFSCDCCSVGDVSHLMRKFLKRFWWFRRVHSNGSSSFETLSFWIGFDRSHWFRQFQQFWQFWQFQWCQQFRNFKVFEMVLIGSTGSSNYVPLRLNFFYFVLLICFDGSSGCGSSSSSTGSSSSVYLRLNFLF